MGQMSEFSVSVRLFLKAYRWRRIDPVPFTRPSKPLSQARLALVSSAGFVLPDQERFDESLRGGDPSFRFIPSDTDGSILIDTHRSESFDHTAMRRDTELAFPLQRVRELQESGVVGSVATRHLSFMGSITAPGRLVKNTAPEAVRALVEDQVDVALLVPV